MFLWHHYRVAYAVHDKASSLKIDLKNFPLGNESVRRGSAGPNGDIDILVQYRETPGFFAFLDLKHYLEEISGRPVDLVTEGALKKQLRGNIMQEAIRVA